MTEQYTGLEKLAIANAREEIRKAKEKLTKLEKDRKRREADAIELEARRVDQSKIDKEDFDDRVRLLLSKMSRELKSLDLKAIDSDNWIYGGAFGVQDVKSTNRTRIKIIAGKGFEWN